MAVDSLAAAVAVEVAEVGRPKAFTIDVESVAIYLETLFYENY